MKSRRQLIKELEELRSENATLKVLVRAYIQSNNRMQDEIALLNESVNCSAAEIERWKDIAHKCDERRVQYVRHMASTDRGDSTPRTEVDDAVNDMLMDRLRFEFGGTGDPAPQNKG